jgi:hypothetical protein
MPMKYCIECGSEYEDGVTQCVDCADSSLITAEEMKRRGLPLHGERDTRRFVLAGTAEDPMTAQQFVDVLKADGIPIFSRPRRGGSVDALTTASGPWWEILVPDVVLKRATELMEREREKVDEAGDDAALAAEEEEAEEEASSRKRA